MSDVVWAALFGSAGAAVVGAASALATIFGPAWRERVQRIEDRKSAKDELRYDRALDFVQELAAVALAQYWNDTVNLYKARIRFVATLRLGEGAMEKYSTMAMEQTRSAGSSMAQVTKANEFADVILGWLRGDIRTEIIQSAVDGYQSK